MADIIIHTKTSVEIFPDRVDKLFNAPNGPVGQHVESKAQKLLGVARGLVGKQYSGTTGKVTDGRSGRLKDAGRVVPIGGASHAVVFEHPIAFLHHEGKRTGYTIPKSGNRYALKNPFSGTRSDGTRFRAMGPVTWKGRTSGNPYLTKAAAQVGLKPSGSLLRGTRPTRLFRLRLP